MAVNHLISVAKKLQLEQHESSTAQKSFLVISKDAQQEEALKPEKYFIIYFLLNAFSSRKKNTHQIKLSNDNGRSRRNDL